MRALGILLAFATVTTSLVVGCSDDDSAAAPAVTPGPDSGTSTPETDSGGATEKDSSTTTDSGTDAPAPTCTAAKATLLTPIATASTGAVTVLETAADSKTIFVDASAGGPAMASSNARVYINLETLTRVDVSDTAAESSTAWDLSLKRPILFTNGGDGGSGTGGAALLDGVAFDTVTTATATAATLETESFFEADCTPKTDETGAVKTTFDGWYDYDLATNILSPHPGTWIVKGGTGKLYKVEILQYYANSDGTAGMAGGRYTLKVGAL